MNTIWTKFCPYEKWTKKRRRKRFFSFFYEISEQFFRFFFILALVFSDKSSRQARLFENSIIPFESIVDGRALAGVARFLGEDFGRLVKHSALDAKHNCGIVDGVGGHGHRLVDDAGAVGAVGHLDDV